MSIAQEIRDFAAVSGALGKVFGSKDDREYKKLRNQLLKFRMQQAQTETSIRQQLLKQRQDAAQAQKGADAAEKAGALKYMQNRPQSSTPSPMDPRGNGSDSAGDVGETATTQTQAPWGSTTGVPWLPSDQTLGAPNLNSEQPTGLGDGSGLAPPEEEVPPTDENDPNRNIGENSDTFSPDDTEFA